MPVTVTIIAAGKDDDQVVSARTVRAHMEMLASDALRGRTSMSRDSWLAATYLASELRRIGVEPAGDAGGYLQSFSPPSRQSRGAQTTDTDREGWNVIGRIRGTDASAASRVVMLGAHLDHIGVSGSGPDSINNGADDDASGMAVVLGLAEALMTGPPLKRAVYVVFFDGEELGSFGASYMLDHPPVPLALISAVLTFEMVGRPDLTLAPGTVWLSGYARSTLGLELARRGAKVVADPYPRQRFFERSDNILFAYRGVVAQTISSYGLHADYHRPSDDLSRIDFDHLVTSIRMLVTPIRSLANAAFEPQWLPGQKPEPPSARRP